ncbi:unnamed protein product [Prunus armeniaca]
MALVVPVCDDVVCAHRTWYLTLFCPLTSFLFCAPQTVVALESVQVVYEARTGRLYQNFGRMSQFLVSGPGIGVMSVTRRDSPRFSRKSGAGLVNSEEAAEALVLSSHAPMVGMLSQSSPSVSSHAFSGSSHGDGLLPTSNALYWIYMSLQPFGRSSSHAFGGRGKFSSSKPFGCGFLSLVMVLFLSVKSAASKVTPLSIAIFAIPITLLNGLLPQLNVRFVAKRAMGL